MRVLLVAFALIAAAAAGGDEAFYGGADSSVHVGTAANFEELVAKYPAAMVEFYAPWCGHCKALKPDYEAAAAKAKEVSEKIAFIAVDATKEEKLVKSLPFQVAGFPTLVIYKDGKKLKDYEGGREADALLGAVEALVLPAVTPVSTKAQYEKLRAAAKILVTGRFTVPDNEAAQKSFHEAAAKIRDVIPAARFVELTGDDSELAKELDALSTPVLRIERAADLDDSEDRVALFDFFGPEGFNTEKLTAWINENAFPVLPEISPSNYALFEERKLPFAWIFLKGHGNSNPEGGDVLPNAPEVAAANKAILTWLRGVVSSPETRSKLTVVWLSGEDYAEHAQQLGVDTEQLPSIAIVDVNSKKRYVFSEAFTQDNVAKFFQRYHAGTLVAHIKSEPVPTEDTPVQVIVAKTFDQLVYEADHDVFVEFYAPWCGHCKKLAPVWEQIAEDLQKHGVKSIRIAKIDATANDVPEQIEGFPTLYYKKAGNKAHQLDTAMIYSGARSRSALLSYIESQGIVLPAELKEAAPAAGAESSEGAAPEDPFPQVNVGLVEGALASLSGDVKAEIQKLLKVYTTVAGFADAMKGEGKDEL